MVFRINRDKSIYWTILGIVVLDIMISWRYEIERLMKMIVSIILQESLHITIEGDTLLTITFSLTVCP